MRMRSVVLAAALSACAAAGPMGLMSASASAVAAEKKSEDTPLAKQMEIMDEGMKKLRRSLPKAAQNAESLEWVGKIQAATIASKGLVPAMASTIPEAQRAKWISAYRKDMAKLLATMAEMEVALLDGDNAKAQELHKNLKTQEDAGHEHYTQQ